MTQSVTLSEKPILVTGATGLQGLAVVKALLLSGWKVRAMIHNPDNAHISHFKELGVEIIHADLDEFHSLITAMKNIYGVFSVIPSDPEDPETEIRRGKKIAEAASKTNVQHFIYSSMYGTTGKSGISYFEVKWQIESYIKQSGLPFTILRPAFFMENFLASRTVLLSLLSSILGHSTLHMTCTADIAKMVAFSFANPEKTIGKILDVTSDNLTIDQVQDLMKSRNGKKPLIIRIPRFLATVLAKDIGKWLLWIYRYGDGKPTTSLHKYGLEETRFEQWADEYRSTYLYKKDPLQLPKL